MPIRDGEGRLGGFFEGVYVVDPATLAHLQEDMLRTLVAVLALVLLTTLIFYPLIVALNRDVLRFSREVLRGNLEIVAVLGAAIAKRDSETSAHNYRVTLYAIRLGEALGVDGVAMRGLILGAFLHDVGKIGISDAILLKPGRLDEAEFAAMRRHVALGVDIISATEWLVGAREVVECHHERYDGRGYPSGLAGEAIPLAARIFALADVFDALTSRRPYKEALALDEALAIIARDAGSHFDPMLAQRFAEVVPPLYHELAQAAEEQIVARLRELAMHYFFKAAGLVTPACSGPGGERPASLMARVAAALAGAAPGGRLPAERVRPAARRWRESGYPVLIAVGRRAAGRPAAAVRQASSAVAEVRLPWGGGSMPGANARTGMLAMGRVSCRRTSSRPGAFPACTG